MMMMMVKENKPMIKEGGDEQRKAKETGAVERAPETKGRKLNRTIKSILKETTAGAHDAPAE